MLLTEPEIQETLKTLKAAFPNLSNWEYNNEINDDYFGFSVWGKFVVEKEDLLSPRFFITLGTYQDQWQAHLTIGQPNYFWSSADVGDAHLLNTEPCQSKKEAIIAIKAKILELTRSFSAI